MICDLQAQLFSVDLDNVVLATLLTVQVRSRAVFWPSMIPAGFMAQHDTGGLLRWHGLAIPGKTFLFGVWETGCVVAAVQSLMLTWRLHCRKRMVEFAVPTCNFLRRASGEVPRRDQWSRVPCRIRRHVLLGVSVAWWLLLGMVTTSPQADAQLPSDQQPAKSERAAAADPFGRGADPFRGGGPLPAGDRSAGRSANHPNVDEGEARWNERLDMPVSMNAEGMSLGQLVKELTIKTGVPIEIDGKRLKAAGLTANMRVSLSVHDVSLRSALRLALQRHRLTFVRKGSSVLITTSEENAVVGEERSSPEGVLSPRQVPAATKTQIVEEALRRKLETVVSVSFISTPLAEVIQWASEQAKVPMILDVRAMAALGLTPDVTVTGELKNVSLRAALQILLRDLELTYAIQDELIQITTLQVAESRLSLKVHALPEPLANRSAQVVEALVGTVRPDTWQGLGGPSSVYAIDNVLVVSTTEATHHEVDVFIGKVNAAFQKRTQSEVRQ